MIFRVYFSGIAVYANRAHVEAGGFLHFGRFVELCYRWVKLSFDGAYERLYL